MVYQNPMLAFLSDRTLSNIQNSGCLEPSVLLKITTRSKFLKQ
uniref:Uncharacterized protein n=1 Tax=Setaria viridis TaxID=4556 RepID=A0A4U6UH35_SETVI|nr:hypothetical protein SEVIR_5G138450v2 [Setaria viridis]